MEPELAVEVVGRVLAPGDGPLPRDPPARALVLGEGRWGRSLQVRNIKSFTSVLCYHTSDPSLAGVTLNSNSQTLKRTLAKKNEKHNLLKNRKTVMKMKILTI